MLLEIKYGTECNGYRNGYKLIILTMDIGSTESVEAAAKELETKLGHLDLIIIMQLQFRLTATKDFSRLISIILPIQ